MKLNSLTQKANRNNIRSGLVLWLFLIWIVEGISQTPDLTTIDSPIQLVETSSDKKLNAERLNVVSFVYINF